MPREPKSAEPLLRCPLCKIEMRLIGIEPEKTGRELYTFECLKCERIEVRAVNIL